MRYFFLFSLLLTLVNAKTLYLDDFDELATVKSYVGFFEDKEAQLTFNDVMDKRFIPLSSNVANFGFTKSAYWLKIDLRSSTYAQYKDWWLQIDYPLLDDISLYLYDHEVEGFIEKKSGENRAFASRELHTNSFYFALPMQKNRHYTIYLRLQTDSSLQIPLALKTSKRVISDEYKSQLLNGAFYGLFIVIFLYILVLYLISKDVNYITYLFFVTSFGIWELFLSGLGVQYLWRDQFWLINHGNGFVMGLLSFFSLYFSRNFLLTKVYVPKIDRLIVIFIVLSILSIILSFFISYYYIIVLNAFLAIVVPVLLLITGVAVLNKNDYRPARFFIIGWSAFLLGSLAFVLNKFGLLPGFYVTSYMQQATTAIQMIFLSWALFDRIQLVQDEYVNKLSTLNATLEHKVKEGIRAARQKDELLIQQSRLAALGEMIEQIAHQWRQPLNTLGLINQDLYFKYQLGQFSEEEFEEAHHKFDENIQYMSQTIDDFRNFFKSDKKKEKFAVEDALNSVLSLVQTSFKKLKIKHNIQSNYPTYVFAVKHELTQVFINILNNARDAIGERQVFNPQINIVVIDDGKNVTIKIEDNAGGIDEKIKDKIFDPYFTTKFQSKGTGIGLYMSKSIINKSMDGELYAINTEKGAMFVINIPKMEV
jgi:signal transduction histidine kinase